MVEEEYDRYTATHLFIYCTVIKYTAVHILIHYTELNWWKRNMTATLQRTSLKYTALHLTLHCTAHNDTLHCGGGI